MARLAEARRLVHPKRARSCFTLFWTACARTCCANLEALKALIVHTTHTMMVWCLLSRTQYLAEALTSPDEVVLETTPLERSISLPGSNLCKSGFRVPARDHRPTRAPIRHAWPLGWRQRSSRYLMVRPPRRGIGWSFGGTTWTRAPRHSPLNRFFSFLTCVRRTSSCAGQIWMLCRPHVLRSTSMPTFN